jgi:hypothetical protein
VPPGNWVPPDHPSAIGANPPPPPATVKITTPQAGSVQTSFAVTGWAIDPAGTNSVTGINAVFIYAYPGCLTCSKPIAVGAATYGLFNAEGAAIDARFANSGYARPVTLAPGVYDLVVFARKTLNNSWISKVVRITVTN